jgi:hypothetical protein
MLRASRSIRVTVATSPGASRSSIRGKLAPVGPPSRHLLLVDIPVLHPGRAERLKLTVEGLPERRGAGIADEPFSRMSFSHLSR